MDAKDPIRELLDLMESHGGHSRRTLGPVPETGGSDGEPEDRSEESSESERRWTREEIYEERLRRYPRRQEPHD